MKRLLSSLLFAGALSTSLAAHAAAPRCPAPRAEDAAAAHAEARHLLAAARDGEHFLKEPTRKALAVLRQAAAAGSREAQHELGALSFSHAFQSAAPTAKDRDTYVEALTWLAVAAHRGSTEARTYFPPGLTASLLDPTVAWRPGADPDAGPFASLPAAWVTAAARQAQAWLPCFAAPACALDPRDAGSWSSCAGRQVTVQGVVTPPERVTAHPVLSGPEPLTHQGYVDVGQVQLIVLTSTPLKCRHRVALSGHLDRVQVSRGPAPYSGWSLRATEVRCLD